MAEQLELVKGAAQDYDRVILQMDGVTPSTAFLGTDVLTSRLWAGGAGEVLATPLVTWVDAEAAHYRISFLAADTADLEPSTYRLQVIATRGDLSPVLLDASLELLAAPGTDEALSTSISYRDLVLYCPVLEELEGRTDLAGYEAQRHRARTWFEAILQRHYRPTFWGDGAATFGGPALTGGDSAWLQAILDDPDHPGLILNDRIKEAQAKRAAAYVLEAQLTRDGKNPYRVLADRFRIEAENLAMGTVAGIDTDGDGVADLYIDLSSTLPLYG